MSRLGLVCLVAVALVSGTTAVIQTTSGDGDWYRWEDNKHYYLFSSSGLNWRNSITACNDMGGYLVDIGSQEENAFIESLPESSTHWIGPEVFCESPTKLCEFTSLSNEETRFMDWESNEPSRNRGYNATYKNFPTGRWRARSITLTYYFVCEFNDACSSINSPCGNEICINTPFDQDSLYKCGDDALAVNECASNQCRNGATCQDGIGNYTCICPPGYEGDNCQTDINECLDRNDCVHGTCTNTGGSYRCNCRPGFQGDRCQYNVDECVEDSCRNGRCVDGNAEYTCQCDYGYEGTYCEQKKQVSIDTALLITILILLISVVAVNVFRVVLWHRTTRMTKGGCNTFSDMPKTNDDLAMKRQLPKVPDNGAASRYELPRKLPWAGAPHEQEVYENVRNG